MVPQKQESIVDEEMVRKAEIPHKQEEIKHEIEKEEIKEHKIEEIIHEQHVPVEAHHSPIEKQDIHEQE